MATTLKRTIYTHSGVRVTPQDIADFTAGSKAWSSAVAPFHKQPRTVQNATMTLNIPRADVNVFGVIGVVDRPQLEAETATLEFAFIPEVTGSGQLVTTLGVGAGSSFDAADINSLMQDSIDQNPTYVEVQADGVGHINDALMNSFSGEATIGGLPTMTMSFTGATKDVANLDGTDADCFGVAGCPVNASAFAVDLVEPKDISLARAGRAGPGAEQDASKGGLAGVVGAGANPDLVNEPFANPELAGAGESLMDPATDQDIIVGCAQSASFAWDLPVEVILCLGANPSTDGIALGNPPGTASFTVEALSLQLELNVNAQNYNLGIGHYTMELVNGSIDSRTHNLAVGDLYGSYNYVIGGTADGFNVT